MSGKGHLRDTIEQAIGSQAAFGDLLTQEEREKLLDFGVVRSAAPGEYLCRPFEPDSRVFILVIGEVEVCEDDQAGSPVLAHLGPGELFGEISALFGLPRISAVRASRPSVLLELPGDILEKVIGERWELYRAVISRYRKRITHTALRSVSLFRDVPANNLAQLIENSSLISIPGGGEIVQEGEPGDAIYIIIYGTARVTRQAGEESLNLALLRAGDYCGEWSVLTGEPRAATVSAVTPVDAIRVDCQPFTDFLGEHPEIRTELDKVANDRRSKSVKGEKLVDSPDAMDKVVSNIQSLIDHSE